MRVPDVLSYYVLQILNVNTPKLFACLLLNQQPDLKTSMLIHTTCSLGETHEVIITEKILQENSQKFCDSVINICIKK
jgi:hypothetical protein